MLVTDWLPPARDKASEDRRIEGAARCLAATGEELRPASHSSTGSRVIQEAHFSKICTFWVSLTPRPASHSLGSSALPHFRRRRGGAESMNDDNIVWLLCVLVVMAAIGLLMLCSELQNAVLARKEAKEARRLVHRKPNGSFLSYSRSRSAG